MVVLALALLLVPDFRVSPLTWLISGALIVGAVALVYGKWRATRD
jgi:hypothetical protein